MDELLLKEAVSSIRLTQAQKTRILNGCAARQGKRRIRYWPAAACACLVCLAGMLIWKSAGVQLKASNGSSAAYAAEMENSCGSGFVNQDEESDVEYGILSDDIIYVNEMNGTQNVVDYGYDAELCERIPWDWAQAETYYRRSLTIEPLPEGLSANPLAQEPVLVRERESGAIVDDTIALEYWNDWLDDENGSAPRGVTEGGKGFTVRMSRVGLGNCCIPVWTEEPQKSVIEGTEVLIGHQILGTLFDENHEPGYEYDVYQAWFSCDGVEYEVTAKALTLEEAVGIVQLLISG